MGCILPLVSTRVEASHLSKDWSLRVQTALLRAGYSDVVSKVHIVVLVPLNTTTVLLCPNWLYSWDNKTICFRDLEPIRLQASYSTLHIPIPNHQMSFSDHARWFWAGKKFDGIEDQQTHHLPLIAKNKSLWLMFPRIKQQTRVSTSWTKRLKVCSALLIGTVYAILYKFMWNLSLAKTKLLRLFGMREGVARALFLRPGRSKVPGICAGQWNCQKNQKSAIR